MTPTGLRRTSTLARLAVATAVALVGTVLASSPTIAGTAMFSGSLGPQSYARLAPGTPCQASGVTVPYGTVAFDTVGTSATTITITVAASGFTPVLTLYQGVFLPDQPVVNCYTTPVSGSSMSAGFGGLPAPFDRQQWILVVAGTNPGDGGSFTATIDSSNTEVTPPGGGGGDTTPPVLDLPDPIDVEATGPAGATVTYTATATDVVDGTVPVTCAPASGAIFGLGQTTVECTATDGAGNSSSGSFAVTVQDTTGPTLTVPADINVEATSFDGAVVSYSVSATDAVDATPTIICGGPQSGGTFPHGATPVTCSANDDSGNVSSATFTVTVQDTTPPALTVPGDITTEATSAAGAPVTFSTSATDTVDPFVTPVCTAASGDVFPLGTTTVSCTATDDAGNPVSDEFLVTIADTTPPDLSPPGDTFATATGPDGADVTYTVAVADAVDTSPDVVCDPPSGSLFPLGTTTVECTAADDEGNESAESFAVIVVDEGDPLLQLPGNQVVEATGPDGADVTFEVTATDDVDTSPDITCTHDSGDTFAIGDTSVSCTATDNEGNTTTGGFTVTVQDTSAPVIDLPGDIEVEASGPGGAIVTWEITATDAVAGAVPVTCTPPSGTLIAVGTTTVTCTATDASGPAPFGFFGEGRLVRQVDPGNVATGTFTVAVAPFQPPTTTTTATTTTAAPPTTTTASSTTTTAPSTSVAAALPETR